MTTHYINMQTANGTGTGLSAGNERNTLPTQVAGDIWSFQRGSRWDRTTQFGITQPLIFTAHGNPGAAKPIFSFNVTGSSTAITMSQDCVFNDISFLDFQPASNAGVALNVGVRGGGAINSGPGAGLLLLNCDFNNIKGNAVQANINDGSTPTASSDFIVSLGCTFNNIGDDAFFVKTKYLRVGWCDIRNVSQLTTTGDCIHCMDAFVEQIWIHDNYLDHTLNDAKQCIMIDDPTAGMPSGFALIERNIILGYGTNILDNNVPINHNPVNVQTRLVFRNNYLKTKRLGLVLGVSGTVKPKHPSEIYSNIFDVLLLNPAGDSTITTYDSAIIENNTFVNRGTSLPNNGYAITRGSEISNLKVNYNLFASYKQALSFGGTGVSETPNKNAFYNINTTGNIATQNDVILSVLPFVGATTNDFRPQTNSLFFSSFNKQYSDFFKRTPPIGVGYIGACLGIY